uniref:Uncharacterized protein n=1 Tax=Anguilla anguilla TaxID=7936 RepID=A0A0E9T815_ANGAN
MIDSLLYCTVSKMKSSFIFAV